MNSIEFAKVKQAVKRVLQNSDLDYVEGAWDKMVLLYFIQEIERKYQDMPQNCSLTDYIDRYKNENARLIGALKHLREQFSIILQKIEAKFKEDVVKYDLVVNGILKDAKDSLDWLWKMKAIQYTGRNLDQIYEFSQKVHGDLYLTNSNAEPTEVFVGDYIVMDDEGSFKVVRREAYERQNIEPKKYKKVPITIEAIKFYEFDPLTIKQYQQFCPKLEWSNGKVFIPTLEGDMEITPGDYIIKGIEGQFYPCKPNIFQKTYIREY